MMKLDQLAAVSTLSHCDFQEKHNQGHGTSPCFPWGVHVASGDEIEGRVQR